MGDSPGNGSVKLLHALSPVTALLFMHARNGVYLLAGEGPVLKIYHCGTHALVWREKIFEEQSIHGICTHTTSASHPDRSVLIWGGRWAGFATLRFLATPELDEVCIEALQVSRASDWVLDGAFCDFGPPRTAQATATVCITANNALITLRPHKGKRKDLRWEEVVAGSRSMLYSAHLAVVTERHVLVAAGTVFGEILVWSYCVDDTGQPISRVHHVYTGHEGSIFGVQISPLLSVSGEECQKRLLASCSDDRTIRVWDLSDCFSEATGTFTDAGPILSKADTGFGGDVPPREQRHQQGLRAKAWGHTSRIWRVKWIPAEGVQAGVGLLSFGEDAACQQWQLRKCPIKGTYQDWTLALVKATVLHTGKNIWSADVCGIQNKEDLGTSDAIAADLPFVATGGADGRILVFSSQAVVEEVFGWSMSGQSWSLDDIRKHAERVTAPLQGASSEVVSHEDRAVEPSPEAALTDKEPEQIVAKKPSKSSPATADSFKNVSLTGAYGVIVTTNLLCGLGNASGLSSECRWKTFDKIEDLPSCSSLVSCPDEGVTFLATTTGSIYYSLHGSDTFGILDRNSEKIAGLVRQSGSEDCKSHVVAGIVDSTNSNTGTIYLLATSLGKPHSRLYKVDVTSLRCGLPECSPTSLELPDRFVVTSFLLLSHVSILILGSRTGSLSFYSWESSMSWDETLCKPIALYPGIHGEDAITSIVPLSGGLTTARTLNVLTTGRDGRYAIHELRLTPSTAQSEDTRTQVNLTNIHGSTPPFGPLIEGAQVNSAGDLILYGFRSKHFVVWNETKQYEVISIECGGAHRRWAYHPGETEEDSASGPSFAWLKASKLHLYSQAADKSHQVLQPGGHGREIKAVAVSPSLQPRSDRQDAVQRLIATGAEDTTIRFSEYEGASRVEGRNRPVAILKHRAIVKSHTTGIQHLEWSSCGRYLFSSGGVEEFFVWRVRHVQDYGIGVVREAACPRVDQDVPDLRITSFAVTEVGSSTPLVAEEIDDDEAAFLISMVFSDSTVRTYLYTSPLRRFTPLLSGRYTTSCLLHVHHHITSASVFLLTSSTSGDLTPWDLTPPLLSLGFVVSDGRILYATPILPAAPLPITRMKATMVHQNAIKALGLTRAGTERDSLLICSGGDDNAVAFTLMTFPHSEATEQSPAEVTFQTTVIKDAHAAAVTGIVPLPVHPPPAGTPDQKVIRVATTGTDQRLKTWRAVITDGGTHVEVQREADVASSIADVGAMGVARAALDDCTGEEKGEEDAWRGRVVVAGVGVEVWDCAGS